MKIGVIIDSFRTNFADGIRKAAGLGLDGIQMYAVHGPMAPENLSAQQRKEMLKQTADLGLAISAICGDPGGHGFADAEACAARVGQARQILALASDLGCPVVTSHIGVIPADPAHPRHRTMRQALTEIGAAAESLGVVYAVETGPEPAVVLDAFIRSIPNKGVGVNLDPANLTMVTDDDAVRAVEVLAPHIVHTHAKDGILVRKTDPTIIYDHFAEGGIGDLRLEDYFREVPLGKGQVDFPNYLRALRTIGFDGFLTIEREVGENPEKDIADAAVFLRATLAAIDIH